MSPVPGQADPVAVDDMSRRWVSRADEIHLPVDIIRAVTALFGPAR